MECYILKCQPIICVGLLSIKALSFWLRQLPTVRWAVVTLQTATVSSMVAPTSASNFNANRLGLSKSTLIPWIITWLFTWVKVLSNRGGPPYIGVPSESGARQLSFSPTCPDAGAATRTEANQQTAHRTPRETLFRKRIPSATESDLQRWKASAKISTTWSRFRKSTRWLRSFPYQNSLSILHQPAGRDLNKTRCWALEYIAVKPLSFQNGLIYQTRMLASPIIKCTRFPAWPFYVRVLMGQAHYPNLWLLCMQPPRPWSSERPMWVKVSKHSKFRWFGWRLWLHRSFVGVGFGRERGRNHWQSQYNVFQGRPQNLFFAL